MKQTDASVLLVVDDVILAAAAHFDVDVDKIHESDADVLADYGRCH